MANLYRTKTIDRLWAILEAHSPFTTIIAQVRRVKDTQEGWLRKIMLRAPGDFPHVQIEMGDRFGGNPIPVDTFESEVQAFGASASNYWLEERTSEFKLSFIYEKPGFDQQDELEMTAIEALEAQGRDLGMALDDATHPIQSWGPWRGTRNATANVNDIVRPVTQIVIPITYQFVGSQLKP